MSVSGSLPTTPNSPGEGTYLVLGILHEAVASFGQQRSLPDLWKSVCRNSRWVVPCHRMVVILSSGAHRCSVAAGIEAGQMLEPFATDFNADDDFLSKLLHAKGAEWITEFDAYESKRSDLHRCR